MIKNNIQRTGTIIGFNKLGNIYLFENDDKSKYISISWKYRFGNDPFKKRTLYFDEGTEKYNYLLEDIDTWL